MSHFEELITDAEDLLHDARTAFLRGEFYVASARLESAIILAGDALGAAKKKQSSEGS